MALTLAQWVQSTEFSAWLAGSTWAYPAIGALHVLAIAWFGGGVLLSALHPASQPRRPRTAFLWTGAIIMLLTGALLFITEPMRCATSQAFRLKMLLLIALAATCRLRTKVRAPMILALWAGVILTARGIAFY
jgi:hypothetical protein